MNVDAINLFVTIATSNWHVNFTPQKTWNATNVEKVLPRVLIPTEDHTMNTDMTTAIVNELVASSVLQELEEKMNN